MVKCPLCDYPTDYTTRDGLIAHLKTKHGKTTAQAAEIYRNIPPTCPHCGKERPITNDVYCLYCGKPYKPFKGESVKSLKRKSRKQRR